MDYNYQDFTDQSFKDAIDIPTEIIGSCFYHENDHPDKAVVEFDDFPENTVCTFTRCNMTNQRKQSGFTYINCQEETICKQEDGEDWHTDQSGDAVSPKDIKSFIKLELSTDPKDIISRGDATTSLTQQAREDKAMEDKLSREIV